MRAYPLVTDPAGWQRTRMSRSFFIRTSGGLLAAVMLAGCQLPGRAPQPEVEGRALEGDALRDFFAGAIDPRRYSITTYDSEAGPVFIGVNRVHSGQMVTLPFQAGGDTPLPVIDMMGREDDKISALIDATSARSWIDMASSATLRALPLNPGDSVAPHHVPDTVTGYASVCSKIRFDTLHVETALLYIRAAHGSLGPLHRGLDRPEPGVVLGSDFLRAFEYVRIDYPSRNVILSATTRYKPSEDLLLASAPLRTVEGGLAAEGALDGEPAWILIDTAGDFEAFVPGGGETMRQISVGDLVVRNVALTDAAAAQLGLEQQPRVGARFLRPFIVTLADRGRMVHFERPAGTP